MARTDDTLRQIRRVNGGVHWRKVERLLRTIQANMIEYRGYTGVVEFDPEAAIFSGHVIDLRDQIYFEGRSVEALEASMQRAVDQYLEVCEQRGEEPDRPFSGNLHVRLGPELHRAAATAAAAEGRSLNAWILKAVESSLAPAAGGVREGRPEGGVRQR